MAPRRRRGCGSPPRLGYSSTRWISSPSAPGLSAREDAQTLRLGVLGFGAGQRWDDLHESLSAQVPGLRIDHVDLDWATQHHAVLDRTVDAGIVWHAGPVDGLRSDVVLSSPRVAVVPTRSLLADATSLTMDDIADGPWLATPPLSPVMRDWLGPAAEPAPSAPVVRHPAATPTAVATSGYIALAHEVARDFYPRPDIRFVPLEAEAPQIAVVTRADDERPTIAALRRAAGFARGGLAPTRLTTAGQTGTWRHPGRSPMLVQ
ncbi:LysR substrate-binding domain-containing protein [Saccharopolyspora sp. NPDC000995]